MALPQLRPLSFGDILDGAFTLYRRHFLTLFMTTVIPIVPMALLTGLWMAAAVAAEDPTLEFFGLFVLATLASILGSPLMMAALTQQFSQAYTGGVVTIGDGFSTGLRRLFPLIGSFVLAFGSMAVVFVVVSLGMTMLASTFSAGAVIGGFLIVILLVVGTIFAFASFFAIPAASVIEGAGPIAAIRRSWALAKGARSRIIGITIVSWIIIYLPMMGVMLLFGLGLGIVGGVGGLEAIDAMVESTRFIFIQQAISLLSSALTFPFLVAVSVLLYYDRRIRTEGYDLEVAAEALSPIP